MKDLTFDKSNETLGDGQTAANTPVLQNHLELDQIIPVPIIPFNPSSIIYFKPIRFQNRFSFARNEQQEMDSLIKKQKTNWPLQSRFIDQDLRITALQDIKDIVSLLKLSLSIYYQAIAILDWVISLARYQEHEYKIIVVTAIRIATKFGCQADQVPRIETFLQYLAPSFTLEEEIYDWEFKIFKLLDFRPNIQTTYNFVEYFLEKGIITSQDFEHRINPLEIRDYIDCMDELIRFMIDVSIKQFGFYKYTPFGLAASIIASARHIVELENIWTPELENITGFPLRSIISCCSTIQKALSSPENRIIVVMIVSKHLGSRIHRQSRTTTSQRQEEENSNVIDIENVDFFNIENQNRLTLNDFSVQPTHIFRRESNGNVIVPPLILNDNQNSTRNVPSRKVDPASAKITKVTKIGRKIDKKVRINEPSSQKLKQKDRKKDRRSPKS